jgi:hypothetical protein
LTLSNSHGVGARVDADREILNTKLLVSGLDVVMEAIGENPSNREETLK